MGFGPYPVIPPGNSPLLVDSANVMREQAVADSMFVGRMFYIEKFTAQSGVDTISRSEADAYKRLGAAIALNYEDLAASWCLGGYDIGRSRGDWCAKKLDELGLADIPAVYCSVDFRPNSGQMNVLMDCLRGFQESALGRRGRAVYGFDSVIEEARNRGLADYFWMCGDGVVLFDGDWREGRRSDRFNYVNLWQQNNFFDYSVDGVQSDVNYILRPDYGQWGHTEEEIDMSAGDDLMVQLMGPNGKGWPMLGKSKVDPSRDNTLVEALAEVREELTKKFPSRSKYRDSEEPIDTLAGFELNIDGRIHEGYVEREALKGVDWALAVVTREASKGDAGAQATLDEYDAKKQ